MWMVGYACCAATMPPTPVRLAGAPTSSTVTPERTRSPNTDTTASVTPEINRTAISCASGLLNASSLMPNVTLGAGACATAADTPAVGRKADQVHDRDVSRPLAIHRHDCLGERLDQVGLPANEVVFKDMCGQMRHANPL